MYLYCMYMYVAAVPVFNFDEGCLPQQCGSVPDDGDEHKTTTCRPREVSVIIIT